MNSIQLKHKFNQYKVKALLAIIAILFIKIIFSWGELLLEKQNQEIEMPVKIIKTNELFNENINYILEKGEKGKEVITNKIWKNGIKEFYKREVIIEAKVQKELKGTMNFDDKKTEINNLVWDYILSINNKDYKKSQKFYTKFSQAWEKSTKTNFSTILKIKWNLKLLSTEPLYDFYTSTSITKTVLEGNVFDTILNENFTKWNLYSYFEDWKFKILNPEYISLQNNTKPQSQFIEGTSSNKTHFLNLRINKVIVKFPNKLYFSIIAKVTENVLFNKIKIELVNKTTKEVLYKSKINYKDISSKSQWKKWVVNWKIWYKTSFWIPIEFWKENYASIMDKLIWSNWQLELEKFELKLTPENDLDIFLNYKPLVFKL